MDSTDHTPTGGFDTVLGATATERAVSPVEAPGTHDEVQARSTRSAGILGLGVTIPEPQSTQSLMDGISLALAVLVAPVGLIAGIVAAVLSVRRLGYVSGLARAAIVVSLVLSVVLGGVGVAYSFVAKAAAHEVALRSSSVALCGMIAATPGRLSDPAFGWPAFTTTIPAYVQDVDTYAAWWKKLQGLSPSPVRGQVTALSRVASASSERMSLSKVIEHDQDYADMQKAASASTFPTWVRTYCD